MFLLTFGKNIWACNFMLRLNSYVYTRILMCLDYLVMKKYKQSQGAISGNMYRFKGKTIVRINHVERLYFV